MTHALLLVIVLGVLLIAVTVDLAVLLAWFQLKLTRR